MSYCLQANQIRFGGENFEHMPCCLCNGLIPNEEDYDTVKSIKTDLELVLIQESCCHSFQDCADGIVPLAYQSLEGLEEYPEDGRLILHYGISYEVCEELLANKNIVFE